MKCLIIDDEPPAQRIIENFVEQTTGLQLAGKCFHAREALDFLHKNTVDLLFLDINMPVISGLSFLRTLQNPPLVIITTAYREYAIEGYELNVVDYLTKPITYERFFQAVDKAMARFRPTKQNLKTATNGTNKPAEFIFVKDDKTTYKIDLESIKFVESMGDYVKIITTAKNYITNQTMKHLEELLPPEKFLRVHKSFIVALAHIHSITGNRITIGNYDDIPIGKTYRKTFLDIINQFQ